MVIDIFKVHPICRINPESEPIFFGAEAHYYPRLPCHVGYAHRFSIKRGSLKERERERGSIHGALGMFVPQSGSSDTTPT